MEELSSVEEKKMDLSKNGLTAIKKMGRKLKKLISKKSASKVTSTQTIADLRKKIQQLEERNALILQNNHYWRKQAKKYRKLVVKFLQKQYKFK